jgi:hypothetical protein
MTDAIQDQTQAVQTQPVQETPAVPVQTDPVVELTAAQKDLEQIQAAITALETADGELVKEEIAALKAKEQAIVDKIKADTVESITEGKQAGQTFAQKYGQALAHGIEMILLGVILGKLFGVI